MGENIFLPKHCVPFCEFFLVTVWYTNVHVFIILDKRNRDERASCFPALSGLQMLPSGQHQLLQDACHVVFCTSYTISATLCPPFPSPSTPISTPLPQPRQPPPPRPLVPVLLLLFPTSTDHPFTDTSLFFQSVVEKLLFFFFLKPFKNQLWIWTFLFSLL